MASLTGQNIKDTYQGLLKTAGDQVNIGSGATARNIVDGEETTSALWLSDTRVGIGIGTPAKNLHIATSDSSDCTIQITNSTTGTSAGDGVQFGMDASEQGLVNVREATALWFGTTGAERMRIAADGYVSIKGNGHATTSTDPSCSLQINGDSTSKDAAGIVARKDIYDKSETSPTLLLHNTNDEVGNYGSVAFSSGGSNSTGYGNEIIYAQIVGFATTKNTTYAQGELGFYTTPAGGAHAERMRIDDAGNVGIGTDAPRVPLQVIGTNIDKMAAGTASGALMISSADKNFGLFAGVSSSGWSWLQASRGDGTGTNYNLSLQADGGNVGIGTTAPEMNLEVEGSSGNNAAIGITCNGGNFSSLAFGIPGDTDEGILRYDHNNNRFEMFANAASAGVGINLSSANNVGIGTLTPDTKLHVWTATAGTYTPHADANEFMLENSANTGMTIASPDANTSEIYFGSPSHQKVARIAASYNSGNDWIKMETNGSDNTLYLTAGKVGLGTNSPDYHLDVEGDGLQTLRVNSTNNSAQLILQSSAENMNSVIQFESGGASDGRIYYDHHATAADQKMYFLTGDAAVNAMVIDGAGKVGMGEVAPESELEITANSPRITIHADTETDGDVGRLSDITFKGEKADGTECNIGKIECSHHGGSNDFLGQMRISVNQGADAGSLINSIYLDSNGRVGIGSTPANNAQLFITHASASLVGVRSYLSSSSFGSNATNFNSHINTAAGTAFRHYNADSDDSGPTTVFYVRGDGAVYSDGGTEMNSPADYAEYFETLDGKAIKVGTTVVLIDNKIRACKDGETPFGVVRPPSASAIVANAGHSRWVGQYKIDDYGAAILTEDGSKIVSDDFIANKDKDDRQIYIPREDRDEWQIVGLLGQVPIDKGQPVPPSWIKMKEISDTVDMYYIFPCAQVINNNKQGESSNEQEQDSSNNNGGDVSSESSGEDSGGVEGSSSDSSDASSGTSEASESPSDDGDESAGSSGSDTSVDSEAGSGGDDNSGSIPSGEPSEEWTKDQLKAYMDAQDPPIDYNSGDTKQDLLDKIGASNDG